MLRANIAAVADRAGAAGVALRPHAKTHKCLEIARLQLAAGATGLTVATVGEAEVFADGGFDDLFIAYPLHLDEDKVRRLLVLAERVAVSIGVDSVEGAERAARLVGRAGIGIVVEIDCGHHRSGVEPAGAQAVARAALRNGVERVGLFTFPGHSYRAGAGRAEAAEDEAAALGAARAALGSIEPIVVSGGSTPSLAMTDTTIVDELRPGVYVFNDAQQWELGACTAEQIALTCHATVVSHAGGRAVLDAGSKILGADRAGFATGFGRLLDHPEARIVILSEHHAVADLAGARLPPLGSVVRVVPNHVCNAVNLVDELVVGEQRWAVAARGRNA